MEETNKQSPEEAIAALKSGFIGILGKYLTIELIGELDAFIWDSPRLEFEADQDCDLVVTAEIFGRSGYGIGLQKNR